MSYTVLISFNEVQRIYAKGTVQTFGEWTDEEKATLIPTLISGGFIAEIPVVEQPVPVEAPAETPTEPQPVQEPVFAHAPE